MASFNPWYVGGGVKSAALRRAPVQGEPVSILGMLEGVLKGVYIFPYFPADD